LLQLPSFPTRRSSDLVHLRQRCYQRLLAAGVALEQGRREFSATVTRHAQLELTDARHQAAMVVAGAITATALGALIRRGAQKLGDRKSTRLNSSHVKI